MSIQDLGSIGELIGAIATVATLVYLTVQIRHNSRSLDQNNQLISLTFANHIREEGTQLRALIAADPELASIWRRGLAADSSLEKTERDRFELLIINVLNMLGAQFEAKQRGLAPTHRATYLFFVARTPGFRRWWSRWREIGSDHEFAQWVDALIDARENERLPID